MVEKNGLTRLGETRRVTGDAMNTPPGPLWNHRSGRVHPENAGDNHGTPAAHGGRGVRACDAPAPETGRASKWNVSFAVAGALLLAGCGDPGAGTQAETSAPVISTQAVVTAGASSTPAQAAVNGAKLVGRWRRPDGGYVLEVRSVDAGSGRMDVAYLNPRPIHVAQAEAKESAGKLTVFVELQDVGYPGSTYRLTYVPQVDQLLGTYYQPSVDQSFEVEFVRMP